MILNPRLTPRQFLKTVALELGVAAPRSQIADLLDQIYARLLELDQAGRPALLIVDEAHLIPSRATFEEIRLLTNFQLDDRNLLAVLLLGQPELGRRLRRPAYEALRQRIGLSYHLGPLPRASVGEYLRFRLRTAGREEPLFTSEAVAAIAELSRGIPRWVNNLAAAALLEGFGREEEAIDRALVEDAAQDLGLGRAEDDDPEPAEAAEPGAAKEAFRD
jgi:type II secretory pathway predicted ATPase ExeA